MTAARDSAVGLFRAFRGRLIIVAALLVGLYFVVGFGGQAWKARQLHAQVAQQQAIVAKLQGQQVALQQKVQEDASPKYLADIEVEARRDLSLAHPGETVLLVHWDGAQPAAPAVATPTPAPPTTASRPNWRKWLDLFH